MGRAGGQAGGRTNRNRLELELELDREADLIDTLANARAHARRGRGLASRTLAFSGDSAIVIPDLPAALGGLQHP